MNFAARPNRSRATRPPGKAPGGAHPTGIELGLIEFFISGSVLILACIELYRIDKEVKRDRAEAAQKKAEREAAEDAGSSAGPDGIDEVPS